VGLNSIARTVNQRTEATGPVSSQNGNPLTAPFPRDPPILIVQALSDRPGTSKPTSTIKALELSQARAMERTRCRTGYGA